MNIHTSISKQTDASVCYKIKYSCTCGHFLLSNYSYYNNIMIKKTDESGER